MRTINLTKLSSERLASIRSLSAVRFRFLDRCIQDAKGTGEVPKPTLRLRPGVARALLSLGILVKTEGTTRVNPEIWASVS